MSILNGKEVVLGVTGCIAAYKAAELVRLIVKAGANVQVVMTESSKEFVSALTFQALSGNSVVTDMFKLYRFENMLYRMQLTGAEIDGFLEHAVGPWFNTMSGPGEHLLQFSTDQPGRLASPYYNFSSAAGINYTVDVSRVPGDRVSIQSFSDGSPFRETDTYSVAINSYRGNGGGGHLTTGAGIPGEELAKRIAWSTDRDLRYYLMEYLRQQDTLRSQTFMNWSCIPLHLSGPASEIDRKVLD